MKTKNNGNTITSNERMQKLITMTSELLARRELASRHGLSYGDDRDMYKSFGWKRNLVFKDYWEMYRRGDIAKQIIDAPVNASWKLRPEVKENKNPMEATEFEKQWADLINKHGIYHYITRADKLSRVFEYSVLFIGFNDGKDLSKPVTKASEILFLRPYKQDNVTIKKIVDRQKDPRFGLPETYELTTNDATVNSVQGTSTTSINIPNIEVHHTRILHLAEGLLEGDVFGTPELESVFNLKMNLDLVAGSSGEMFFRGAFPGMAFILEKDATFDSTQALTDFETEIEKYFHNMQRTMKLQGMNIENLAPQVADPSAHINVYLDLIAGATRTPKRILIGTERGDLASSQDETAWNNRIEARRVNYCEPMILRKFIGKLQEVGILPETPDGYTVKWPDISVPTEEEKVKVIGGKAKALSDYTRNPDAQAVLPPEMFLSQIMELDDDTIEKIMVIAEGLKKEREEKEEKERENEGSIREEEREFIRETSNNGSEI